MWIVCQADDSHEMSGLVFFEKKKKKKLSSAAVVIGALRVKNTPLIRPLLGSLRYDLNSVILLYSHVSIIMNQPIQIYRKFHLQNLKIMSPPKSENFQIKNSDIFSFFGSKHRLWLLVRTALTSQF